jgi:hypothetical protein
MNVRHLLLFLAIAIVCSDCRIKSSEIKPPDLILDENFDSNKIGWVEEYTNAHKTEIRNGFLYINAIDTSAILSSNGPLDYSFLLDFPNNYEISSSITLMERTRHARFGILLSSSSIEYKFSVSDSGTAAVMEWDNNRRSEIRLFTQSLNADSDTSMEAVLFEIKVHFRNFEFYINNKLIGEGILNSKNWRDIRLFTTTGSGIAVDYLRIKKVE